MEPIFDQICESRSLEELQSSSTFDENYDYGDLEDIMDFNHQIRDALATNAQNIILSKAEHFSGYDSFTPEEQDWWDEDWVDEWDD